MAKQKLKDSVEELRNQVSQNTELADEHKEDLTELAGRIDAVLNTDSEHWEEKLVDGMEQKLLEYEESHPVVARIIQEILTTLSNIGV